MNRVIKDNVNLYSRNAKRLLAVCLLLAGWSFAQEEIAPLVISSFEGNLDAQWGGTMKGVVVSEKDPAYVKEGEQSGKWTNMSRNKWLICNDFPSDWSNHKRLVFWLYSEEANFQQINVLVESNVDGAAGNYYIYKFNVDWKGWERVEIPFSKFSKSRDPKGWNHITKFMMTTMSYGAVPLDNTVLYLDDMRLENWKTAVLLGMRSSVGKRKV